MRYALEVSPSMISHRQMAPRPEVEVEARHSVLRRQDCCSLKAQQIQSTRTCTLARHAPPRHVQCERGEVVLKIVIAPDSAIVCHHQQPLIFRPSYGFDGSSVPLNLSYQLPCATVEIYGRFGCLGGAIGVDLGFISVQCCQD